MAKTHTSTEVKQRYNKKTYNRYYIAFRKEDDRKLIEYIEARQAGGAATTEIFREALELLMEEDHARNE